jgi:hypothetical protein
VKIQDSMAKQTPFSAPAFQPLGNLSHMIAYRSSKK